MPIIQQGAINTAALVVPGVYVQIIPPAVSPILGLPSNIAGMVGTASWGPVNAPTIVGDYGQYLSTFGPLQNRTFDMGTHVAVAVQQGANNFRCVRVTDGTDTVASCVFNYSPPNTAWVASHAYGTVGTFVSNGGNIYVLATAGTSASSGGPTGTGTGITDGTCVWNFYTTGGVAASASQSAALFTLYTGSNGNNIVVTLSTGSAASSWKLRVQMPGFAPEVFDNIAAPTPAAFWTNLVNAVNNGNSPTRGASKLVGASLGTRTSIAPTASSTVGAGSGALTSMTGGTDGVTSITAATLIGTDGTGSSRTGMYALRGSGAQLVDLCDATDPTQWANQVAYGLSEGSYMILTTPAGDTIATATANKTSYGLDTYAAKLMFGDWVYWSDYVNGVTRFVSPQAAAIGRLANLAPQLAGLNQPLAGIVGTQKSVANGVYSAADLQTLIQAGFDVIANPSPGGRSAFTMWSGRNASSNSGTNGDNYTRLTNFIAPSLQYGMGNTIGKLQTADQRAAAYAQLDQFLSSLWQQGLIGNADGTYPAGPQPWSIKLDSTNNPPSRVALGYEQADISIQYLSVIDFLLVNMQAGQSVQISRAATS